MFEVSSPIGYEELTCNKWATDKSNPDLIFDSLEASKLWYWYMVVPYRFWRFCATWEGLRWIKDNISITIILSVIYLLQVNER